MAFVTVSVILVGTIYSSSVLIAFGIWDCVTAPNAYDQICSQTIKGNFIEMLYCYEDHRGDLICITVYETKTGDAIAPGLRDALENTELETAIQDTQNDTKVPKTGILDEPDALRDDEDESTENGDDTEVPREDILPDNGEPTINDPQTTTEPKIKVPGKIEFPNLK